MNVKLTGMTALFRDNSSLIRRRRQIGLAIKTAPSYVVPSVTYLVNQGFEETGFDNNETWITYAGTAGAANPDYATSPIEGSHSLRMKDDSTEGTYAVTKFADDTGITELWGFFKVKFLDLPSTTAEVMQTYNAQGSLSGPTYIEAHEMIWITSGGVLQMWEGDKSGGAVPIGYGSTALSIGTVYCVWWYVSRSSDGKSTGWIKLNTSTTLPESNEASWTNVDISGRYDYRGTNCVGFTTLHGAGYECLIDHVLIDDASIGSL